jgi:hypothetical protein
MTTAEIMHDKTVISTEKVDISKKAVVDSTIKTMEPEVREKRKVEGGKSYAKEEMNLKDQTLSKTAPDHDQETKCLSTVKAPTEGGMKATEEETRIEPPSGKNIDRDRLELRDKTLADTAQDIDPEKKCIAEVTAPERGGMRAIRK